MVEWRPIPGWHLEASSEGDIRNPLTGRVLSIRIQMHGYRTITVRVPGRRHRCLRVARLVCTAFHGPPPPNVHTDHIDHDRANDRPENLRWLSPEENRARRRPAFGSSHWCATLTEDDVAAIRRSDETTAALARVYGVHESSIRRARRGDGWKHVSVQQQGSGGVPTTAPGC